MSDLLAIQAQTLEEFAAQAHSLFYGEDLAQDDISLSTTPALLPRARLCVVRPCL